MQSISRNNARKLVDHRDEENVAVVEVLSPDKYAEFHLPGALNVPLDDDFRNEIQKAVPDKQQTVLLYCYDADCEASSKAASQMEELGYQKIYDYEAGKVDWKAAGLPVET